MKTVSRLLLLLLLISGIWTISAMSEETKGMVNKAALRISVTPTKVSIPTGKQKQLKVRVKGKNTSGVTVEWSILNGEDSVSVDNNGLVTALQPGIATVLAQIEGTEIKAKCRVTVRKVSVKSIKLEERSLLMKSGEEKQLHATISPSNASVQTITWSSNNEDVAIVDSSTGVIMAIGKGKATITAVAEKKRATCTVTVKEGIARFTVSAVGDVIIGGDTVVKGALGKPTLDIFTSLIQQYGEEYPFKNVAKIFKRDDLTIVNLEGALTDRTEVLSTTKENNLKGPTRYAKILKLGGVDVCNLSNNHVKDYGAKGYQDTVEALKSQGILSCGNQSVTRSMTTEAASELDDVYIELKKNGISVRLGILGYITPISNMNRFKNRIALAASKADLVIVCFHWGDTPEWTEKIYASDRKKAQFAIDNGADLVIGHHRHIPAGIEMYKDKYIAYDLGNFVVGLKHMIQNGEPVTNSMILQWSFDVNSQGEISNFGIAVIPCTTTTSDEKYPATDAYGDEGAPLNKWQPDVLTGKAAEKVIERIQKMSSIHVPRK